MISLVSTRFDNNTWNENVEYRRINNITGCRYGVPYMMSPKIELDSIVFIIEMNNSINKIEGIGLIKNKATLDKSYNVYEDRNFNRYSYQGNYRINRDQLEEFNPTLVESLDQVLFKGKTHLKRGIGFTKVPDKLFTHEKCKGLKIKNDIKEYLQQIIFFY